MNLFDNKLNFYRHGPMVFKRNEPFDLVIQPEQDRYKVLFEIKQNFLCFEDIKTQCFQINRSLLTANISLTIITDYH